MATFRHMTHASDIEILDERGVPAVVVEVKSKLGTTPVWAAIARRNLAAHGWLPNARFFVLAVPDRLYFWVNKTTRSDAVPPDFITSSLPPLSPYLETAGIAPEDLSRASFEFLVSGWFAELARDPAGARLPADAIVWAEQTGFLEAVRRGRLELH